MVYKSLKIIFFYLLLVVSFFYLSANCQTDNLNVNHGKSYDELLNKKLAPSTPTQSLTPTPTAVPTVTPTIESPPDKQINNNEKTQTESTEQKKVESLEKDELVLLLSSLDNELYKGWSKQGDEKLWQAGSNLPLTVPVPQNLLTELEVKKILTQSFTKEGHNVEVVIYEFKDFTQAYSAYTVLHNGTASKLKVGRNTSESENLINFWKDNYFVDIHNKNEQPDNVSKEFIVLFSQDIGKNILIEQLPPVVAIQLPSLYRVQDSEKYCTGLTCCEESILKGNPDINCNFLNLQNSGGSISAQYQISEIKEDKKPSSDEEKISLILTRYTSTEDAELVFNTLKDNFEKKQKENKEIDITFDPDDSTLKVQYAKNNYTMLKQRGNLLGIAYKLTNKKSGEQVLGLIPWPIQINKPIHNIKPDEAKE